MPVAFLIFGLLALLAAVNNSIPKVMDQIAQDFLPAKGGAKQTASFLIILALFLAVAVLGKITRLERTAEALLALIIAVYLIGQPKIWGQFAAGLKGVSPQQVPSEAAGGTEVVPGSKVQEASAQPMVAQAQSAPVKQPNFFDILSNIPKFLNTWLQGPAAQH